MPISAWRHLDEIAGRGVEGAVAAMLHVCTCAQEEGLGCREALNRARGLGLAVEMCRKSVHLLDIEHGIALHERNPTHTNRAEAQATPSQEIHHD